MNEGPAGQRIGQKEQEGSLALFRARDGSIRHCRTTAWTSRLLLFDTHDSLTSPCCCFAHTLHALHAFAHFGPASSCVFSLVVCSIGHIARRRTLITSTNTHGERDSWTEFFFFGAHSFPRQQINRFLRRRCCVAVEAPFAP